MTLSVYSVRYVVPAPPCYKGDPYPRTATREKIVATRSNDSAIDYVKAQLDKDGVDYRDITATYLRPYHP